MSNYPNNIDSNQNLFTLHDSLRLTLAEDYNPGDVVLYTTGDPNVFANFPQIGYITLTDQCNDAEFKAISFSYSSTTLVSSTSFTFNDIQVLPNSSNIAKP